MIPRADIAYLSLARPLDENLAVITQSANTRFPLVSTDIDHVIGMVHVKDLFNRHDQLHSSQDLAALKREILFVPESRPLDALQRDFQHSRTHMAIVVDEYGGTDGIVTLEDLVEELVGEIRDEYDPSEVVEVDSDEDAEGRGCIDGRTTLEHFAETFGVALDHGPYETVAGYLIARLGRIPEVGDSVDVDRFVLQVSAMSGARVTRLVLSPRIGPQEKSAEARRAMSRNA